MQRYDEFDLDDLYEEEEEESVGPGSDLSDDMLMRIYQVSLSNKRGGMADQGFPKQSSILEAKGLLEKRGDGWFITTEGLEIIRAQQNRLKRI